ncbi:hypothetical protein EPT53_09795 [Fusobacterium necrophorum]|uniref:Fimbrial assembly protein n=1 Tax=Fusobacterium necrophorum TaxID=859 RepID=A0A4Q2KSP7_9FUSO|nr:hypothetical protein [Fusobacterium necrophorum]RXZ68488.1 hypothetical protein EPT53_09795 [Fusobacterium necrophorum]
MKYLLYTLEDIKEKQKIPKNCVLILENHFFTTMLLTIVPSVDEDDRKEMIYEKLSQEYFLDVNGLSYLYYDVVYDSAQYETIFCCYSNYSLSFILELSPKILYAIPECLLGSSLSSPKTFYLLDFQEKEILILAYKNQKICSFQKIANDSNPESILQKLLEINESKLKIILLGKYTKNQKETLSQYFPLYCLEDLRIKKIKKEVDIFHHKRADVKIKYLKYLYFVYTLGIFFIIFFGFYWQYRLEALRTELISLEQEISKIEYESNILEDKIVAKRQEKEKREQEFQKSQKPIPKIHTILRKIYNISKWKSILCMEHLENETLKLQLKFMSQEEYLDFVRQLLKRNFELLNHDRIEKIRKKYEVEIEIIEADNEEKSGN